MERIGSASANNTSSDKGVKRMKKMALFLSCTALSVGACTELEDFDDTDGDMVIETETLGLESSDDQRVVAGVMAEPFYLESWSIPAGVQRTFETRNLGVGVNSVLHIWDGVTATELAHDVSSGQGNGSRVVLPPVGHFRIIFVVVRAFGNSPRGHADLFVDGQRRRVNIPVGGTRVTALRDVKATVHVVQRPGGSKTANLLGFSGSRLVRMGAPDIGEQQSMPWQGVSWALVGPSQRSAPGLVDLVVNDPADADGDGLGEKLERALGTCAPENSADWPAYCDQVANVMDSDGDGLNDGWEVLGIDVDPGQGTAMYLPAWGADPLQKDVFVQVDYVRELGGIASVAKAATLARTVQLSYLDGTSDELRNPNGEDGLRVHLDIGIDPNPTSPQFQNGDFALFGDWSPSDRDAVPSTGSNLGTARAGYLRTAYFGSARKNVFRYAMFINKSCRGSTESAGRYFFFCANANGPNARTFTHELGHTMGLNHQGLGGNNFKPNYPSLMNYRFPSWSFSHGQLGLLNGAVLIEEQGIANMSQELRNVLVNEGISIRNDGIDWNRDGIINPEAVRANPIFIKGKKTGSGLPHQFRVENKNNNLNNNVDLLRVGDRIVVLWPVYRNKRPQIAYRSTSYDWLKDYTPKDNELDLNMSPVRYLPVQQNAIGLSAVEHEGRLWLAYRSLDSLRVVSAAMNPGTGALQDLSPEQNIAAPPAGFGNGDGFISTAIPEIYVIENGAPRLQVMMQDSAKRLYVSRANGQNLFGAPSLVRNTDGTPLRGSSTPNIVWGFNGQPNANETACGVFTSEVVQDNNNGVYVYARFGCLDLASQRWTTEPLNTIAVSPGAKPGIAYLPHRQWSGNPIGTGTGTFYVAGRRGSKVQYLTSAAVDPATANLSVNLPQFSLAEAPEGVEDTIVERTSIALFVDENTLNMKGAWFDGAANIMYFPHADGITNTLQEDTNDFELMADKMCGVLRPAAFCP